MSELAIVLTVAVNEREGHLPYRRYFTSRAALQHALDGFMRYYTPEWPHQGYRVRGRTPGALVWGVAAAQ